MHSLVPGQSVSFAGPLPGYTYQANQHPRVALIAGGAGITPMYQLIRGILNNPRDNTKITLVWGVNTDADIFLDQEFKQLQAQHPERFTFIYTASQPEEGSPYPKGYITKQLLEKSNIGAPDKDTKVFVCGPPAMENAVVGGRGNRGGILSQLGYSPAQVHKF
jgi:cytochrome-b5 reductase